MSNKTCLLQFENYEYVLYEHKKSHICRFVFDAKNLFYTHNERRPGKTVVFPGPSSKRMRVITCAERL